MEIRILAGRIYIRRLGVDTGSAVHGNEQCPFAGQVLRAVELGAGCQAHQACCSKKNDSFHTLVLV